MNKRVVEPIHSRLDHPGLIARFVELVKKEGLRHTLVVSLRRIKAIAIHAFNKVIATPEIFTDKYHIEDNAEIVLFLSKIYDASPLSSFQPQKLLQLHAKNQTHVKVSLIATIKNEESNVKAWTESVLGQTRLPDEIIITDAGSTDKTLELLKEISSQSPVPFDVISEQGVNIAQGRNIAIAKSRYTIIATTDFGCRLQPDWLEKLVAPFETEQGIDVSAGMYQAVDRKGNKLNRRAWWTNDSPINLKWFLPSGRSSAFTKEIWQIIGGYPEWLTLTGEDTYFALELKKYAHKWAFVPEAIVEWHAPDTTWSYWRKMFSWSIGEGESGLFASSYWKLSLQLLFLLVWLLAVVLIQAICWIFSILAPLQASVYVLLAAWVAFFVAFNINLKMPFSRIHIEIGGLIAKVLGFLHGARQRHQVDQKRRESVRGTFFILSGIPIDDTGGGARCTQISLELLRRKFAVVFVNKFPKYETHDLHLAFQDKYLYTYQLSELDWNKFSKDNEWLLNKKILGCLVEMPLEEFKPLINSIRSHGGVNIYDLLDDWNTQLGGSWFSDKVEAEIIEACEVLLATAPILAERLSRMSEKRVEMFPNAVNTLLFNPDRLYERPSDLPKSEWTAIYIGALWGEWLDWDLMAQVATRYPTASVVAIGDYKGQCHTDLPNLHFLGLKPQTAIPAYLAYSDVAIIPWKVNEITRATSPLKVFEYLAMRKPVVAPDIDPLRGIPAVYLAGDQSDFVDLVGEVRGAVLPDEAVSRFIMENNWQARVNRLLDLVGSALPQRPIVHKK